MVNSVTETDKKRWRNEYLLAYQISEPAQKVIQSPFKPFTLFWYLEIQYKENTTNFWDSFIEMRIFYVLWTSYSISQTFLECNFHLRKPQFIIRTIKIFSPREQMSNKLSSIFSQKTNELIQSSQAGVYFFNSTPGKNTNVWIK